MSTTTIKDGSGTSVAIQNPPTPGQATMAGSVPVVVASDQPALPVAAAALPLPTGAATSANQPTLNADGGAPAHVTNFPATQPVSLPQTAFRVPATPTISAVAYGANKSLGGVILFANSLPSSTFAAWLESITLKFKATVQTCGFYVAIFSAGPSGTFADNTTAAISHGDSILLLGLYHLTAAQSPLGSHTIYNLDGIRKAFQGSSTSLYAVVVPDSPMATAAASTSELIVELGMLWG